MIEKFKKHWFSGIVCLMALSAGTTWKISEEIRVKPRDYTISHLRVEIEQIKNNSNKMVAAEEKMASALILKETGVNSGNSVTTSDGICKIYVLSAGPFGETASISVIVDSGEPAVFKDKTAGDRIVVESNKAQYYIDINRVRGSIVDLSVYRQKS